MKYNDVIERLQNLTLTKINTTEIAEILDVPVRTLYTRAYRNSEVTQGELKRLEDFYNINLFKSDTQDNTEHITLDYYPDIEVSCGNGIIPFGETKEKMTIPVSLIKGYSKNKKYVIVSATSDSMQPEIKPNDMLIIRVTDSDTIIDNHIYVFCYNERLYCKYLSYNVNQIIVRSANKDYPTRFIEKENINDFKLCGEVCGHFRSYLK